MPVISVRAATPIVPPGSHPATLIDVTPKSMVTKFSKNGEEQDFFEWTWDVDGEELTSLTTRQTGAKSRIIEYLVALLGPDGFKVGADIDTDDLVGKSVMLSVIDDGGFSKVERVIAAPKGKAQTAKVSPKRDDRGEETGVAEDNEDDLPF